MAPFANWEAAVLRAIGAPLTQANIDFLDAWQKAEGGTALNNPLNTTQPIPGASNYNSVGVKNYNSPGVGAQATAITLQNGRYPNIVAALKTGNPARYLTSSVATEKSLVQQISTWGTNAGTVLKNYESDILKYKGVTGVPVLPVPSGLLPGSLGAAAAAGAGAGIGSNLLSGASLTGTLDFLKLLTDPGNLLRGLEIVGGAVLILVGVFLLAKQVGLTPSAPAPVRAAAGAVS